jgi:hypothetical protein
VSALEKTNRLVADLGYQPRVGCTCGGNWWYVEDAGVASGWRLAASVHTPDCKTADAPPQWILDGSAPPAARLEEDA